MYMTTYKQSLAQSYSAAAQTYDRAAFVEQQIGNRLLERLDSLNIQPQLILDLGCGTGYFTQQLRASFPQASIINLDLAFEMAKFASQQNTNQTMLHSICADAEQLPLKNQSIDLIFANCCIMHIQKLDLLCKELKRVLTPKGMLIFSALGSGTLQELAMPAPWPDMHYYGDALLRAQFTDPVVEVEILHFTYNTLQDLLQDLAETGTYQLDDYSQLADLDEPCSASFEIIYGCAWSNSLLPNQSIDENGNHFISTKDIKILEYL